MAGKRYQSVIPVRVNFYDLPHNRTNSSGKDSYYKNCYPEQLVSGMQGQTPRLVVTGRPGTGSPLYSVGALTARGQFVWKENLYQVYGNAVYKNGSALTVTLSSSTGKVYWTEMSGGTSSEKLFLLAGNDIYSIKTDGTVTLQNNPSTPDSYVGTMAGGIINLDGYILYCDTDGKINHNATQNDTAANITWASNIISANIYADGQKGIARHLNYVVSFGDWSTEFFYNAGNTSGSILARAEGTVLRYGTCNFATLWQDENIICWLARSRDGGNCVMILDGLTPKIVSTQPIEKIINEDTDLSQANGFGTRIAGHIFYFLQLPASGKTLVFSLTNNTWCEWTSYNGAAEAYFNAYDIRTYMSGGVTKAIVQGLSDGNTYPLDINNYSDNGNAIKTKIVTDVIDFQTAQSKFLPVLTLLGDRTTATANISMRYSDDDYQTWSTAQVKDMQYIPVWRALGRFNRRAFEFTYEANYPFRVEALEFGLKLGTYAQGRA